MRIPILRGAEFTERQGETDRPVVIINDAMARRYWADANPIGARVHIYIDEDSVLREVVGVAGDVRSATLDRVPVPEVFVPHAQAPVASMGFTVRTAGDPAALLPAVRQRVAAIDPDVPLVRPQTMNALVDASTGAARLSSVLTSMFAIVAAMLATVGIYGLVAYSVAQRTREIGIRVALGANPAAVLRLIVGEGLVLALCGLALGLAGTWALTGTLRTMLFEVSPADPAVLGATCLAVVGVTCGASFVPARRVMRVDPTIALRAE
jgi:predicted permease